MGRIALTFVLCVSGAALTYGQSVAIGTRTSDGKIRFEGVDDFLIDQGKKIKVLPPQTEMVDGNVLKRLAKSEINQAGIIRNDGTGRLVRLNGAGKPADIVVPENFALKTPVKTSEVPGRLALAIVRSRKAKQSEPLAPELFFVYLTGPAPDQAVLRFLSEDWAFKNLDEQLAAMEGFVASFKDSPAVGEFRNSMERRLREGLEAFENGGPDKNLRALQPIAVTAAKAFTGYAPMVQLRDRIFDRVHFVDAKIQLLKSLAVLGDWDKLLDEYQDFERYQWSFDPVMALRKQALAESARMHAQRAIGYQTRAAAAPAADAKIDHEAAMKEATRALERDPDNKETRKFADAERVQASQIAAKENEARRKVLAKGSPQDVQFGRNLAFADRSIQDKDYAKAQEQIQEADALNPGAPETLLRKARLVAAQGRLTEALGFLDDYDNQVSDPAERQKGQDIRNDSLYDLEKKKGDAKREIEVLRKNGEYSKLDKILRDASKLDPADPDFEYDGGLVAAALRDTARAKELLSQYRQGSNSLEGDPKKRDTAGRLLNAISSVKPVTASQGSPNWFSARKLPEGVYYCPESLAFQIPIESVSGNKVRMAFNWDKGQLQSLQTTWEDEKGRRNYLLLGTPGGSESDAAPSAPAGEEPGAFYFEYFPSGQLRRVRTKKPAPGEAAKDFAVHVTRDDKGRSHLVDADNLPDVVLPGNRYVDTEVLGMIEGPVATIVAGNSVFNPFLWDGLHYFSVRYDGLGRASSAEEWNADSVVRFSWDQDRLTEIRAYHKGSETPYYQRSVTYSGTAITAEDFTLNGRSGHIRYVYTGKSLTQIKIDTDGKDWIAKPRS